MGVSRKCNQGPHAVDDTALRCVGAAAGDKLMLHGGGWGGVGGEQQVLSTSWLSCPRGTAGRER